MIVVVLVDMVDEDGDCWRCGEWLPVSTERAEELIRRGLARPLDGPKVGPSEHKFEERKGGSYVG